MNIKNNFLISFRHLKEDKLNSLINITGLILGLGIVTVIVIFVLNELCYNSSFLNSKNIYRVLNYSSAFNNIWANTPFIIGETLPKEFEEVEKCVHTYNIGNVEIKKDNDFVSEPKMFCTESSFFDVFGVNLLSGSLSGFDQTANKVLVSRDLAQKYFKNNDPLGKILTLRYQGKEFPMEITAIFEDFPQNSTIKASLIAGVDFGLHHLVANLFSTGEERPDERELRESWKNGVFFTNWILLQEGTSVNEFKKKLLQFGINHSTEDNKLSLELQPLSDVYFGSGKTIDNNSGDQGNLPMLYILGFIGLLILTIACINYLNLSSAKTMTQTKALAVRKVCGASRKSLLVQMITESVLVSLIALPFAIQLAQISLPYISNLLGKSYLLTLNNMTLISIGILVLITLLTGTLSGLMVSLKITSFRLTEALKGRNMAVGNKHNMRKVMVIFQISVFIILIAIMVLVRKQVDYAFSKDLGFTKEGLIKVVLGDHNYELFKQEISQNSNIVNVSGALWIPPHTNKMIVTIPKVDEPDKKASVMGLFVDYNFSNTMGLKVLQGTDFDETKNNSGVLVNESAIKELGLKEIIGENTAFGSVIGVVSDFNMYSIHEAVTPMIIGLNPSMCREIAIRINTQNIQQTLSFLKDTWKATGGTTPFEFEFTNDTLRKLYESDIRFSQTIGLMAVIAILIASLGLFGLSVLLCQQKTKEIGIRRINGARITEIMIMLNKDFVKWIVYAFLIACPVSLFFMHRWLQTFVFKTELSWWVFAIAGLLALAIALITVSWQTWRAATRNPVEALRYE